MKYKGYTGVVEFDEESGVLFGHVIGLRDYITFQGDSVAEITQAFRDSVNIYLELCAERGESPEKPYSGQFVLRIDPRLHRVMSHAAEQQGVSLNRIVEERLEESFGLAGSSDAALEKAPPRAGPTGRVRGRTVIVGGVAPKSSKGPDRIIIGGIDPVVETRGDRIIIGGTEPATKPRASSPKGQGPKSSKGSAPVKGGKG